MVIKVLRKPYLSEPEKSVKALTDKEIREAKKYLKQTNLMEQTDVDIGRSGIVGEGINRFLMLMVFTSRKLRKPLNIISLSISKRYGTKKDPRFLEGLTCALLF